MKKSEKTLGEIEKNQMLLRDSIAESKRLSDQSDKLIKRHRREVKQEGGE